MKKRRTFQRNQTAETAIEEVPVEGNNMAAEPADVHTVMAEQKGEAQSETYITTETSPDSRADDSVNGVQGDFVYVPDVQSLIEKLASARRATEVFLRKQR